MDKYGDSKRAIMDKKIQDEIFTFIVAVIKNILSNF